MAKRHTNQNHKQKHGQFFTKNANQLLARFAHYLDNKNVIDPFCGDWDLLNFAIENEALSVEGFDLEPKKENTEKRDSILNPPDFRNKFLLTNPPYLCSNKNKDKSAYDKWGYNDLYKCHIASFVGQLDEGILILPSNFLSESSSKTRDLFFSHYTIVDCDYYYYSVFPGVTTGITVFYFKKDNSGNKSFPCKIHYSPTEIVETTVDISREYGWLYGKHFFDFINDMDKPVKKWTGKEKGYLSNVVIGLLDKGKWKQGFSINLEDPIVCSDTTFTTYQMVLDVELPISIQEQVVELANDKMQYFRNLYHGLFLSNFMGANQKIYSRTMLHGLFWKCLEITLNKHNKNNEILG